MNEVKTRVVVVDDEPIVRMDLREVLELKGYDVVAEASDGIDAISACSKYHPDIVFMDIKMPIMDGLSASKVIYDEGFSDTIILLTAFSSRKYIDGAIENGVSGYLVKPIVEDSIVPAIEIALSKSKELKGLKHSVKEASDKLSDRIVIEKAKGYIMESKGVTEDEAYKAMRTISQKKNISMKKVAEYVVQGMKSV